MKETHPIDDLIRTDRIPHIWCSGCGIGIAVHCFLNAIRKSGIPPKNFAVVSGIGCSGRVAGYVKLDSFHTTHGRPIPFAVGLKLANDRLKVVVFSGDGDLIAIGGNHFIHAARRNVDITVICVNNFNYGMTGGQAAPTTPVRARTSTTPYGNFEFPFNLAYLAAGSGAVYVSRWTTLHAKQLEDSMLEALGKKGFTFVEAISPCPTLYNRMNKLGTALDFMKFCKEHSVIRHGADPKTANIDLRGDIVVGRFVNVERPTFTDFLEEGLAQGLPHRKALLDEERKEFEHE
ncbi:MAG: 2-oxoacid:ferredoxin oxidoreductase subunit beta [Planctomycetota bacterium]|nr:2-oxoacid:ferredoxin oxidoreductase subunit beta [Planctomycetota bacterium]